jgi:hypothetical protein
MGDLDLRRIVLLAGAFGLCVDFSCSLGHRDDDDPVPGPSRKLDEACAHGGCILGGSASLVTGLTSDSVAIRIGPGPGSAHVALPAGGLIPAGYRGHVELLVSGAGSFSASNRSCDGETPDRSDAFTPPADYGWVSVGPSCGADGAEAPISVTVSGSDASVLDIVDVRVVATKVSGYGCSMARWPRR